MVTRYFHKTQNVEALGKEIEIILGLSLVIETDNENLRQAEMFKYTKIKSIRETKPSFCQDGSPMEAW